MIWFDFYMLQVLVVCDVSVGDIVVCIDGMIYLLYVGMVGGWVYCGVVIVCGVLLVFFVIIGFLFWCVCICCWC